MTYFAEYACGCVSQLCRTRKDVLDYCGTHGDDARRIHSLPSDKALRRKKQPAPVPEKEPQ